MKPVEITHSTHQLTQDQIDWLNRCEGKWTFDSITGVVNSDQIIVPKDTVNIPVQFGEVIYFNCYSCTSLKSLQGGPTKCEIFNCYSCTSLESLQGAPKKCNIFYCYGCTSLESLQGAPKKCNIFYCYGCTSITSLRDIEKQKLVITGTFFIPITIKSHLFGVVFCNINQVYPLDSTNIIPQDLQQACGIINRCLSGEITRMICQKELIQAGLGEFARM